MDDLIFEQHARNEMARDSISEDDVYLVVSDYDVAYERDNGRIRYERTLDDGRLIVVIVEVPIQTVRTV